MFSSQLILRCWQLQPNQLPELCHLLQPFHKSSVYHETAAGATVKAVSYLVAEDHRVGQARLAKVILIFPGCILAFHVVGSVHSIHFSYWWQKPSGYYGVALKQSGWNVTIAGSSLWLSFILAVGNELTTRFTSGFLLSPMFTSFKVVIIQLILSVGSSSVFPSDASSDHQLSACSPDISAVLAILLYTQPTMKPSRIKDQLFRAAFQVS